MLLGSLYAMLRTSTVTKGARPAMTSPRSRCRHDAIKIKQVYGLPKFSMKPDIGEYSIRKSR